MLYNFCYPNVGDLKLVTIFMGGNRISMLITSFECWWPTPILKDSDVGDQNGQNHHQHLIVVSELSPTHVSNIRHQNRCMLHVNILLQ